MRSRQVSLSKKRAVRNPNRAAWLFTIGNTLKASAKSGLMQCSNRRQRFKGERRFHTEQEARQCRLTKSEGLNFP
jgi:hypothetical protein